MEDKGFIHSGKKLAESRITQGISSVMNIELSGKTKLTFTRDISKELSSQIELSTRKKNLEKSDLAISIHVSEDIDVLSNKIIVYVNSESEKLKESKKLGCLAISKLTGSFGEKITSAEIKESNSGENEVIPANIPAIRIEIGNIKADPSIILYENQDKIGRSLAEAIKNYYSKEKSQKPKIINKIGTVPRTNFAPGRSKKITHIVIHESPPCEKALSEYQKQGFGSSPHYLICADGKIYQLVSDQDTAFHAAKFNSESIGIEHESVAATWSPEMIKSSTQLSRYLAEKYDIPKTHPSSINQEGIIGHDQIAAIYYPGERSDPQGLDWNKYIALISS